MKPSTAQQQALLTLLSRIYTEIRTLEEAHHIQARADDFRPRIEYFHDAVRALTNNAANGFEHTGRLSVESLARDVVMLRQIKENPRIAYPELPIPLSPRTDVAPTPPMPISKSSARVDVGVVAALADGYAHYALLFAALLAYPAERNYMNRLSENNDQQGQVHDLIATAQQGAVEAQVNDEAILAGITDPELRRRLMTAIVAAKQHKHASNAELLGVLKREKESLRTQQSAIESAHMRYASSQLVLFQEAQKLVKKMAAQGLNMVGEFVENAVREAERGGRGF